MKQAHNTYVLGVYISYLKHKVYQDIPFVHLGDLNFYNLEHYDIRIIK